LWGRSDRRRHVLQELVTHLLERQAFAGARRARRFNPTREVADGLLQIRIVAGQGQRGPIALQCVREFAAAVMNVGDAANGGEVVGRALEDMLEFHLGSIQLIELGERAP
jgi:hypothetical protein